MAGGPKLFDYRMTEKEYILAETIIEMTDKSELFRTGLEHFDWSEIEVIPTGDRPHDSSYHQPAGGVWYHAIWSNQCIEVWFLLHFSYFQSDIHRKEYWPIPAKYYDLMQTQKPELLAENVNSWFADKPSSYMVRSMDYKPPVTRHKYQWLIKVE